MTDEHMEYEPEPVAWINRRGDYVEVSRPDTVYGSHTIPLYTAPPTTKAIEEAAYRKAIDACKRLAERADELGVHSMAVAFDTARIGIESFINQPSALEEFGLKVAEQVFKRYHENDITGAEIVRSVMKGEG